MSEEDKHPATEFLGRLDEFVNGTIAALDRPGEDRGREFWPAETMLSESWADYELLPDTDREALRQSISRRHGMCLWHYAIRMAELAVRRDEPQLIRFALLALTVDDEYTEYRDLIMALALVQDAALRVGVDVQQVFRDVARRSSPNRLGAIEEYLDELGDETSMESFFDGWEIGITGSGESFKYRT